MTVEDRPSSLPKTKLRIPMPAGAKPPKPAASEVSDDHSNDCDDHVDCPACGGSGVDDSGCTCGDDCCCCLHPEPPACGHCGGAG